MKIGNFFDATFLISGMWVMSADAILNAGTLRVYNRSTLSSSKGVEKHVMFFLDE